MSPIKFKKAGISFSFNKIFDRLKLPKFERNSAKPSRNFKDKSNALKIGDVFMNILRKFKIRQRLIASFLLLSLVPLIIMGVFSYNRAKNAIHMKISTYSVQIMNEINQNIQTEITKYENILSVMGYTNEVQLYSSKFDPNKPYETMLAKNATLQVFRANTSSMREINEVAIFPQKVDSLSTYAFKNTKKEQLDGIIKEIAKDKSSTPHWSIVQGEGDTYDLVVARDIISTLGSDNVGVLMMGIEQNYIASKFENINIGDGAEIFVLDSNGMVLSSRSKAIPVGKEYADKDFINALKDSKSKGDKVNYFNYKNSMVTYSHNSNTDWYIVGLVPYSYLNAEVNSIAYGIGVLIIICMLIALLLSFIVSGSISSPIKKLVELMVEASNGNLSVKVEDKSRDEIGNVISNFNNMVANIRSLVSKVNGLSQNVLSSSEKISDSAEKSYSAAEQISVTIQEVAKGASNQASDIAQGVIYTNNLSDGINKVGGDMNDVSDVITNASKLGEEAMIAVKMLNDKAIETNNVSEKIVTDINSLNNDMKEIKEIVKAIVGIAEQTNLLSLNAAIEAARAGEAGRGFAVVADEVKKLAEQSKQASVTINNIINGIQNKTQATVNAANNGSVIMKEQIDVVNKADNSFKTILNAFDNIVEHMENMRGSVKDMLTSKDKTLEVIENISAVSEESAATAEEVSASTQEQIAGAEVLSSLAKDLTAAAQELNEAVSIFKVE